MSTEVFAKIEQPASTPDCDSNASLFQPANRVATSFRLFAAYQELLPFY
jgi:hypothetical protein